MFHNEFVGIRMNIELSSWKECTSIYREGLVAAIEVTVDPNSDTEIDLNFGSIIRPIDECNYERISSGMIVISDVEEGEGIVENIFLQDTD